MTAAVFLSVSVKKIHHDEKNINSININNSINNDNIQSSVHSINIFVLAHFLMTLVLGLIQFYGVRYITLRKKYLITRKYQSNIVTFNSNFFFFFLFEISGIMRSLAMFKSDYLSPHFHVYYYKLFTIFVFGFIRPIIILLLLKRNMPEFFTEETQELHNENKRFNIIGNVSPTPRPQTFSRYQPFSQNARWGWQSRRIIQVNEATSSSDYDYRLGQKSLASVEI